MIIERTYLYDMFTSSEVGTVFNDSLVLYISFKDNKVRCKKVDFSPFINDFSAFPTIQH